VIPLACQVLLILALLVTVDGRALAQGEPDAARTIAVHYDQREIATVVEKIARATGRRYLFGDTLRGRISITVPDRVSHEEAIALMNAALRIKGFAALPVGKDMTKIVPIAETNTGAPLVMGPLDAEGERPITTLIRLQNAGAHSVAMTLRPYVSSAGLALAYPPSNSLILAGTEARVSRLITIARILDQAADEDILVRALRYRSAEIIAEILDLRFNQGVVAAHQVRIWTDARTNQIIVSAPSEKVSAVRDAITAIDTPDRGSGLMRVIHILNRDADEVAEILRSMQAGTAEVGRQVAGGEAVELGEGLSGRSYSVTVDPATRSLLLASDSGTLDLLLEIIGLLDQLPSRIVVDVLVFELTRPSGFKLGVDYFLPLLEPASVSDPAVFLSSGASSVLNPLGIPNTGVPSGPSTGDFVFGRYTRAPLQLSLDSGSGEPITISIPRENVSFQAGESTAETNILLHPHIVAMSGEEHEIFVGSEIPVPIGSSGSLAEPGGVDLGLSQRQIIERREVGIRLRVKPTVGIEGTVILDLKLETSAIQSSIAGSVEQVGPTFAQRTLETTLRLSEGQIAVIGTNNGSAYSESRVGVPFLKDIPFFGWLFGSVQKTRIESDLLIVVEAEILRHPSEDIAHSIRREIAMERAMSRVADLRGVDGEPFAVLLETVDRASKARRIAEAFAEDGFQTRVTDWKSTGGRLWDVYLTNFETFEMAGGVARRLFDAGWSPEVTALSPQNALAGD